MHTTEPLNYLITIFASSLPVIYMLIVARSAKTDMDHTDQISREQGQTNHTGILDLHTADGHRH